MHDQNFKNLILDYPLQALQFFAANEATEIDESVSITPIRQEQLKQRLGDRFRELDCPLLIDWPDGRREALLFVFEEETEPRHFSIHRLALYCIELSEMYQTDRVVPVVIFLRKGYFPTALNLGSEQHCYLHFDFLFCQLASLSYDEYKDSNNLVVRLNLPNMRYKPNQKIEVYAQAVKGLWGLENNPHKQEKYLDYIDIYAALDDNEFQRYCEQYPDEVNKMSAFAERFGREWREQGREEGREEGLEQGELRGLQKMLLAQLSLKFGQSALDNTVKQRIDAADSATLMRWSKRVLSAQSMSDLWIE